LRVWQRWSGVGDSRFPAFAGLASWSRCDSAHSCRRRGGRPRL